MNRNLNNALSFSVGAAAGIFTTWNFFNEKYSRIAQEEIDSVKEEFSKAAEKPKKITNIVNVSEMPNQKPDLKEYAKTIARDYSQYAPKSEELKTEKKENDNLLKDRKPYVISPDEYGEVEEYSKTTLMFYSDGVITDEQDIPMEPDVIDDTIGLDATEHFGEFEDDTVFICNDAKQAYYEILRDYTKFERAIADYPKDE